MKKRNIIIFSIILIIIDQIIKYLVHNYIINDIVIINNFFSITNLSNYGAAFGILSNNIYFLIFISLILIYFIISEIKKNNNKGNIISLLMILSGALGNLIDRIFRGYVVDYMSFELFNISFPVFNFADMLITFGTIYLIYIIIKEK